MRKSGAKAFLLFLSFSLILVYSIRNIFDLDIWVHLKTGEYFLKNLQLLRKDIYSYTASGNLWINSSWLFQILVYLIYRYLGFPGIIIFKTIFILLSFYILFHINYQKENFFFYLPLFLISIFSSKERFYERPEFISFLFIALYLKIIFSFRKNKSRSIFLLPFLQILWTNLHIFSFVGLGILAIFLIGDLISWKVVLPWQWNKNNVLKEKDYFLFLKIFLLSILVSFLNPFGPKIFLSAIEALHFIGRHKEILAGGISELISPLSPAGFFSPGFFWYKVFILLTLFCLFLRFKKLDLSQFFLYAIFLHLSLVSLRNIVLFSMVSYVISADNLNVFLNSLRQFSKRRQFSFLKFLAKSTIFLFILTSVIYTAYNEISFTYYVEGRLEKKFGLHKSCFYPDKQIDFIRENNLQGNIFNSFGFGAYFIYRCFPERKVFIDGRTGVYGEEFLRYYADIHLYLHTFEHMLNKYKINYILLDISAHNLFKKLYQDKDNWRLVYFGCNGAVFVRNIPENKELIKKYEIDLENLPLDPVEDYSGFKKRPFPISCFSKGELFLNLGLYRRAEKEYLLGLEINPELAGLYNNLGVIYQNEGEIDKAVEYYKKALKIDPHLVEAILNLGAIYQEKGDIETALNLYKKALSPGRFPHATLYNHLADIYRQKGLLRQALLYFDKAISLEPNRYEFHYNKGVILLQMGKISQALDAFYQARDLEPSVAMIYNNIAACLMELGRYTQAEKELNKALELDPNLQEAKENLEKLRSLIKEQQPSTHRGGVLEQENNNQNNETK